MYVYRGDVDVMYFLINDHIIAELISLLLGSVKSDFSIYVVIYFK